MEQQSTLKKSPETHQAPPNPTQRKRIVVTIDATAAMDPLDGLIAAQKELQRQIREKKEETARKHAKNVRTIEQAALAKMLSLFFPVCSIPSVSAVPGANNKVVSEAVRLANSKMRQLRQRFVSQVSAGQVRDALATLEAAVETGEGRCSRGGQGGVQKDGQEAGR